MARVFIPPPLRDLTGGTDQINLPGMNVRQIVEGMEAAFPGIAARLTLQGALAPGLAVSVDGVISNRGLLAPVGPDSEVHFLPAFGGG